MCTKRIQYTMSSGCFIRVDCSLRKYIKSVSLTHDTNEKPTESYDSIIRRAVKSLKGV